MEVSRGPISIKGAEIEAVMSLRPRYSLLTLLVLTALVAGGVKLWYGPHRVVEQMQKGVKGEYIYTRDMLGNQILHGPVIVRIFREDRSMSHFTVTFFRKGEKLDWQFVYSPPSKEKVVFALNNVGWSASPLNEDEYLEFKQAVANEGNKLPQGLPTHISCVYEGTITP
jgi:hypothetical protein